MQTETITWRLLPADPMPDADTNVLAEVRDPEGDSTEVWTAFWSGERWIDAGSGWPIDNDRVVAWGDMPAGART